MKITRLAVTAYVFALLIILLDQATKAWVISGLTLHEVGRIPVLPPILNFSWVENTGVSFGLFGGGEGALGSGHLLHHRLGRPGLVGDEIRSPPSDHPPSASSWAARWAM